MLYRIEYTGIIINVQGNYAILIIKGLGLNSNKKTINIILFFDLFVVNYFVNIFEWFTLYYDAICILIYYQGIHKSCSNVDIETTSFDFLERLSNMHQA